MSGRPEFLFLAHRIPYPPDKGDKIRSYRFLRHFAGRFDVHLAAFVDDPADFAHRGALDEICASVTLIPLDPRVARLRSGFSLLRGEPLTYGYYRDGRMQAAVAALRRRPLVCEYAFSSSMAPYLDPPAMRRPRIADICDADSEKWREYSQSAAPPMKWIYAREHVRLAAAETKIVNGFDVALAISSAEAAVFESRPGIVCSMTAVGNGVDTTYFAPTDHPRPDDAGDVVFIGAMDYKPNIDAALWFAREAWSEVRAARPQCTFTIVGSKPAPEIQALAGRDDISVTGRVPDVRPYLSRARVVIAPLKIARGVQNKVLEAMAAGKAVVATPAANVGIDAAPGKEIVIAEGPADFATAVVALLADEARAGAVGAAARARAISDYSWESKFAALDDVMRAARIA